MHPSATPLHYIILQNAFSTYLTCFYHCSHSSSLLHYLLLFIILSMLQFSQFEVCSTLLSCFSWLFQYSSPFVFKCIPGSVSRPLLHAHPLALASTYSPAAGLTPILMTPMSTARTLLSLLSIDLCFQLSVEHIYQNIFPTCEIGLLVIELIYLKTCPFPSFHLFCWWHLSLLLTLVTFGYRLPPAVFIHCHLFLPTP